MSIIISIYLVFVWQERPSLQEQRWQRVVEAMKEVLERAYGEDDTGGGVRQRHVGVQADVASYEIMRASPPPIPQGCSGGGCLLFVLGMVLRVRDLNDGKRGMGVRDQLGWEWGVRALGERWDRHKMRSGVLLESAVA